MNQTNTDDSTGTQNSAPPSFLNRLESWSNATAQKLQKRRPKTFFNRRRLILIGSCAAAAMILIIVFVSLRDDSYGEEMSKKIARADKMWDAGKVDGAADEYQAVIDDYGYGLPVGEARRAYNRLIEHHFKVGGADAARKYIYKALQHDVLLTVTGADKLIAEERVRLAEDKKKTDENWATWGKQQREQEENERIERARTEVTSHRSDNGMPSRGTTESADAYRRRLNPTNDPAINNLINAGTYTPEAASNVRALRKALGEAKQRE